MGTLQGALSGARFRVVGDTSEGWRERFRDQLTDRAFREPPGGVGREPVEGWVQTHNLLDTDFTDFNRWLYNDIVVVSLRVDRKRLPAALVRARLAKRIEAWCEENGVAECSGSRRADLKEELEREMLAKIMPTTQLTDVMWAIGDGWAIAHTFSEPLLERIRKRFFQTFGCKLVPWSPLDYLEDAGAVQALAATSPSFAQSSDGGGA